MDSVIGIVVQMNIYHMKATIAIDDEGIINTKVNRIYDLGDEIEIYPKPWFLQRTDWALIAYLKLRFSKPKTKNKEA